MRKKRKRVTYGMVFHLRGGERIEIWFKETLLAEVKREFMRKLRRAKGASRQIKTIAWLSKQCKCEVKAPAWALGLIHG